MIWHRLVGAAYVAVFCGAVGVAHGATIDAEVYKVAGLGKGNELSGAVVGIAFGQTGRLHVANVFGTDPCDVALKWEGAGSPYDHTVFVTIPAGGTSSLDVTGPPSGRIEERPEVFLETKGCSVVASLEVVDDATQLPSVVVGLGGMTARQVHKVQLASVSRGNFVAHPLALVQPNEVGRFHVTNIGSGPGDVELSWLDANGAVVSSTTTTVGSGGSVSLDVTTTSYGQTFRPVLKVDSKQTYTSSTYEIFDVNTGRARVQIPGNNDW